MKYLSIQYMNLLPAVILHLLIGQLNLIQEHG